MQARPHFRTSQSLQRRPNKQRGPLRRLPHPASTSQVADLQALSAAHTQRQEPDVAMRLRDPRPRRVLEQAEDRRRGLGVGRRQRETPVQHPVPHPVRVRQPHRARQVRQDAQQQHGRVAPGRAHVGLQRRGRVRAAAEREVLLLGGVVREAEFWVAGRRRIQLGFGFVGLREEVSSGFECLRVALLQFG